MRCFIARGIKRGIKIVVFAGMILASVLQVGAAAEGRFGGTLRVAIEKDPVALDPSVHFHAPGKVIMHHMGEGLVGFREDMTVGPVLARSIEISEDGTQYIFKLRKGARFHNGALVTAEDVKWVWENFYLNPDVNWEGAVWFNGRGHRDSRDRGVNILSIEAPSKDRVVFRLQSPSNVFLSRLADISKWAVIFHRDSLDQNGGWKQFIGTGPYRLHKWEKGKYVDLIRFKHYVPAEGRREGYVGEKIAYLDKIRFVITGDAQKSRQALLAGDVDVWPWATAEDLELIKADTRFVVQTAVNPNWYVLLLQTRDPLLKDVRLRRAIAHAIDYDKLARMNTEGWVGKNPSPISPFSSFYSAVQAKGYAYDPALSRKLQQEAGYAGHPIRLEAPIDAWPAIYKNAPVIRDMLRAAGFNIEFTPLPWDIQLNQNYKKGTLQLSSFGYGMPLHPSLQYDQFMGDKNRYARAQWDSPEAVQLVDASVVAPTRAEQQAYYDRLHEMMIEEVPIIGLYNFEVTDVVVRRLKGYESWMAMRPRFWGVY